jgi:hypothetical protein
MNFSGTVQRMLKSAIAASALLAAPLLSGQVDRPAFVQQSLFPVNQTSIERIIDVGETDLVILRHGLGENFRIGAFCTVERGGEILGELVIVDSDRLRAVALITDLGTSTLRPGDFVRLRVVSSTR